MQILPNRAEEDHAASYKGLRRFVGILGFLLPASLIIAAIIRRETEPSISAYYYTGMGDVLVGTLAAIAAFLGSYRGFVPARDEWISDRNLARIAAFGAIGVALLPCYGFIDRDSPAAINASAAGPVPILHLLSAAAFLGSLGGFALFKFTRSATPKSEWPDKKHRNNRIYIASGVTIFTCLAIAALMMLLGRMEIFDPDTGLFPDWLFWLEVIAVLAFALSWLVKGEAIEATMRLLARASTTR